MVTPQRREEAEGTTTEACTPPHTPLVLHAARSIQEEEDDEEEEGLSQSRSGGGVARNMKLCDGGRNAARGVFHFSSSPIPKESSISFLFPHRVQLANCAISIINFPITHISAFPSACFSLLLHTNTRPSQRRYLWHCPQPAHTSTSHPSLKFTYSEWDKSHLQSARA